MQCRRFIDILARSFVTGEQTVDAIDTRCAQLLGRRWRWVRYLAKRHVAAFGWRSRPRRRDVAEFMRHDRAFQHGWREYRSQFRLESWLLEPQRMQPVEA